MLGVTQAAITGAEKTKLQREKLVMKYRSRAPVQGACLKGMSRTISMLGFTHQLSLMQRKPNFDLNC